MQSALLRGIRSTHPTSHSPPSLSTTSALSYPCTHVLLPSLPLTAELAVGEERAQGGTLRPSKLAKCPWSWEAGREQRALDEGEVEAGLG